MFAHRQKSITCGSILSFGDKMMNLGLTGTQEGLNANQFEAVKRVLSGMHHMIAEVHHGDCIGADVELVTLINELYPDIRIISHPPIKDGKRAWFPSDLTHRAKPYLHRNRDIVEASDVLWAFPAGAEKLRSGTWSTVRYARKVNKPYTLFTPDGAVDNRASM